MNAGAALAALAASLATALAGCAAVRAPSDDDWPGSHEHDLDHDWDEHIALHIGRRDMDDAFLPGSGNDPVVGVEISGAPNASPVDFVLGLWGSGSWGSTFADEEGAGFGTGEVVSTGAAEISLGLRFAPRFGPLRPYAGIGVAAIKAHRKEQVSGDEVLRHDSSGAGYWQTGLVWEGRTGWTVGAHYRELFGSDLTLGDEFGDADYHQFTLSVGVHF